MARGKDFTFFTTQPVEIVIADYVYGNRTAFACFGFFSQNSFNVLSTDFFVSDHALSAGQATWFSIVFTDLGDINDHMSASETYRCFCWDEACNCVLEIRWISDF